MTFLGLLAPPPVVRHADDDVIVESLGSDVHVAVCVDGVLEGVRCGLPAGEDDVLPLSSRSPSVAPASVSHARSPFRRAGSRSAVMCRESAVDGIMLVFPGVRGR